MNDVIRAFLKLTIASIIIWVIIGYLFDLYIIQFFELIIPFWILTLIILCGFVISIAISFSILYEKYLWKHDWINNNIKFIEKIIVIKQNFIKLN